MEKIVLVAAGGHCKVIIDIIKSTGNYEIVGITDTSMKPGEYLLDVPILGDDNILHKLFNEGVHNAFICIGALNNIKLREKIANNLLEIGFKLPVLIHPKAIVAPYAQIKSGTCVMAGTVINSGAVIKENCIINTSSVIEHDCTIGRNVHISPRACICGGVSIGNNTHIGAGAVVIQVVNIGSDVVIGAGSVVIKDIENNVTAVGVPSKMIKHN